MSGLGPRLSRMVARRGAASPEEAASYLEPSVGDLHDPNRLDGIEAAVARLIEARAREEAVVVVGDYDVDGITATALLLAVFRACGLTSDPILPHRMRDGYGFRPAQVERARELGASVIVTADCGSHSHEAVEMAREAGLDVIITDHHLPGEPLPEEVIHVNPHQESSDYPFRDLSGAGIAFKLAQAFARAADRPTDPEILLRVACLGTIADMVPLRGENRSIAALGLEALATSRSIGLRALLAVSRVSAPISAGDVGFRLGPRINAAGRMDSPDLALELLLTRDPARAEEIAGQLDQWNSLRQQEEARVVEEATEIFEQLDELPPVLVAWRPSWHRGVVGIAAGRLSRRFHRPALLLSVEDDQATGSGRSIPGLHLHDFLLPWRDRLLRFGGHSQAVGLTASLEELPQLRDEWVASGRTWDPELLVESIQFEEDLKAAEVDQTLLAEVERLAPFGIGNPRPIFRVQKLTPASEIRFFGANHVSLAATDESGGEVRLVGWRWAERAEELRDRFDALGRVTLDRYLGRAVLELVDVRPAETSA